MHLSTRQQYPGYGSLRGKAKGVALAITLLAAGFAHSTRGGLAQTSVLDPAGPRAARIADLWWVMFVLGLAVFFIVMALLAFALLVRGRRHGDTIPRGARNETRPILIGVLFSLVIMVSLFGYTLWTSRSLAEPAEAAELTIEVAGYQWWWEVRYPDESVVTANEVHIPVGVPVALKLTSDNVIHSFWVPRLSEKMDLIPGRTNEIWIQADEPGTYLGECAEFCGIQHALMQFRVIAEPTEEFSAWLEEQRAPADVLAADSFLMEGQQIFLGSACVYCHAVQGTNASGQLGPDLTHLASRQTLAAGALDNNIGNLSAWIVAPQAIKPGNMMPDTALDADELQALVAYLMSLD